MNKKDRLLALQYSLYERVRNRIYSITGPDSEDILEYEHSFLSSLPDVKLAGRLAEFKKSLDFSKFILLGDFHALPNNQQDYLDLLHYLYFKKNHKKLVIALECFSVDDQPHIDSYILGNCDEKSFLSASEFAKYWGFPWRPIKKILDFAKKYNLPVVGTNVSKGQSASLSGRDKFFAQHLLKAAKDYEDYKLVYLVGEHHLSSDHLPTQMIRQSNGLFQISDVMVILSNTDKYYFSSLENAVDVAPTFFQLEKNNYCILDTPPWGKWFSYLVWQEHVLMQPGCDTCVHPWAKHGEEQCCYDTEEYFIECFNFFIKYFGEEEVYHPLCSYFNRIAAVEKEYFNGHEMEDTWAYYRFQNFDSTYCPEKKIVYWKPLSWRGVIAAIAQCLSLRQKSVASSENQGLFYENIKTSLVYYSFESIFNPVGFLNHSWIKKNLLGQGNQFVLEDNKPTAEFLRSSFNPYLYSHGIGQSLANLLNKPSQIQGNFYDYLHQILRYDFKMEASLIEDLCRSVQKKHA